MTNGCFPHQVDGASGLVLHVLDASPMMKVISFLMTSDDS
jgi:hypothetical protein